MSEPVKTPIITCPVCEGDGAVYVQVRVGQFKHPVVCPRCEGDGECEAELSYEKVGDRYVVRAD